MTTAALATKQSPAATVPRIPGPNHVLTMKTGKETITTGGGSASKRMIRDCPHTDLKYYAKGMCVNCYHRRGRTKKAWACEHVRKTHYSKGLCKYCYLNAYYKHRTVPTTATTTTSMTATTAGMTDAGGIVNPLVQQATDDVDMMEENGDGKIVAF